jgi:DnaJ-class molecular chaperone
MARDPKPFMVPCPTCNGTRFATHEDRHIDTRADICKTCGGEGEIPAATGTTEESSFNHRIGKAGDKRV